MKMLRWPLGLTWLDWVMNEDVRKRWGVAPTMDKMRVSSIRWYGHVVCCNDNAVAKTGQRLDRGSNRPRGRPKKCWMDRIKDNMKAANVTPEDALDRKKWRKVCKTEDPASRRTWTARKEEKEECNSKMYSKRLGIGKCRDLPKMLQSLCFSFSINGAFAVLQVTQAMCTNPKPFCHDSSSAL